MIFRTRNSTYEIDRSAKQIRRLRGANPPTETIASDLAWRPYQEVIRLEVGRGAIIAWNDDKALHISTVLAIEADQCPSEDCDVATRAAAYCR